MKKAYQHLLNASLLAAWSFVSFLIAGSIHAVIGNILGRSFWKLESSLGRFTIHITQSDGIDVVPFSYLMIFLILTVLNIPVVWLITRQRKKKGPEQAA